MTQDVRLPGWRVQLLALDKQPLRNGLAQLGEIFALLVAQIK